jgi:Suppressor of fused protein (SUFU)
MTESKLIAHIEEGTGITSRNGHPTYYDAGLPMHPTEPVDYDEERLSFAEKILGEADFTYHPAVGSPHVDIHRFPATTERQFTCYLTSGMSDVVIHLRDGSSQRVELVACTSKLDSEPDINSPNSITQVVRYVSIYPFIQQIGIGYYHVIELPSKYQSRWGSRILLIPPFLLKDLAFLPLMGQKVFVLGMIRITDSEFSLLMNSGPESLFNSWEESLQTWLFDTNNREIRRPTPQPSGFFGRLFGKK